MACQCHSNRWMGYRTEALGALRTTSQRRCGRSTSPQGRTVRAKHAARVEDANGHQTTLWADIRTAPRKHMETAFRQRRGQILGECRQLKSDVDSYNENASPGIPIPMSFNFTYDLEEEALAS